MFLALPISMHASRASGNYDIMVLRPGFDPSREKVVLYYSVYVILLLTPELKSGFLNLAE